MESGNSPNGPNHNFSFGDETAMAEQKSNRGGQNFKDLTGQRFGRLTVIERGPNAGRRAVRWLCRCDCGSPTKLIHGTALRFGLTVSCGCKHLDAGREKTVEMTGLKFGRLTVQSQAGSNYEGHALWLCLCDCGNVATVIGKAIRRGTTKSCGCWRRDVTGDNARTHGMAGTPEYKAWKAAKERCFNPNCKHYENWGGRGITMAPEWVDSFEAFYAHIGPKPKGGGRYSVDRVDNERGYQPGNVRWATDSQQAFNRRSKWRHSKH